jgi:hypothetical protein
VRRRVAVLVAAVALAAPAPAAAHLRTSRVAVDYRAAVSPLSPDLASALSVRLYRADLAVRLTVHRGHRSVVLGYAGEPFLRLEHGEVLVNADSPTAAGAGLTRSGAGWHVLARGPSVTWHDARVRGLPQGIDRGAWSLPLVVDGQRVSLHGTIERVSAPSRVGWLVPRRGLRRAHGGAPGAAPETRPAQHLHRPGRGIGDRRARHRSGLLSCLEPSEGVWVESANEAVFVLAGAIFLFRGSRESRAIAGGFLGLVALTAGLTRLPVLSRGIVRAALPGQLVRLAVVVAIGAGAAGAILGVVVFFDVLEHYEDPELKRAARS